MKDPREKSAKKGSLPSKRMLLFAFFILLVLICGAVVFSLRPWEKAMMDLRVSVATDTDTPVQVYSGKVSFNKWNAASVSEQVEIDLSRWEGSLVRIDIESRLLNEEGEKSAGGIVGVAAELTNPDGTQPLEYAGWINRNGFHHIHPTAMGSPAFIAREDESRTYLYSPDDLLWCVMRPPEKTTLKIVFKPVDSRDLPANDRLLPPGAQQLRMPPKQTVSTAQERPPDVFIYLIDTLRADHLGCYGYDRPTSPTIDAFTKQATLFSDAQAATTWTRPSVATIVTGLYPTTHGLMHGYWTNTATKRSRVSEKSYAHKLADWMVLLPEALKESGYKTCTVAANHVVGEPYGFSQGSELFISKSLESYDWVHTTAMEYIAQADKEQPVYALLHTMEPHDPYIPTPESLRRFDRGFQDACDGSAEALEALGKINPKVSKEDVDHLIDLYDAEIFDADRGFADFLRQIKSLGRYDNSLIILVADHGEAFNEHRTLKHGVNLNQELLHVPLIIKFPQGSFAGMRVDDPVSLIDIFPTVLAQSEAKVRLDYRLPGVDLTLLASGVVSDPSRCIYAEVSQFGNNKLDLVAIIDENRYKRVIDLSNSPGKEATPQSVGLWDTKTDAAEQQSQLEELPVRAAYDEQLLSHWLLTAKYWCSGSASTIPSVEMTEEMREELRALGYLE